MDNLVDTVEFYSSDGVFVKLMGMKHKNTIVIQHVHKYDHLSLLARGSVLLFKGEEEPVEYKAPEGIEITAGTLHKFMSLEDDTIVYCIHNVSRTGQVEIE